MIDDSGRIKYLDCAVRYGENMLASLFTRELVRIKSKRLPFQDEEQIRHKHELFNANVVIFAF